MIVTVATDYDTTGEAARLSADGERARMLGDTGEARNLHEAAGKKLKEEIANHRKQDDKNVIRFLAATQYYLGGSYRLAENVCRHINAALLPDHLRESYTKFLRDVKDRSGRDYSTKIRERIRELFKSGQYQRILDLLKDHPYAIEDEATLAGVRSQCCEHLADYRAAAIFLSDAIRKSPNNGDLVLDSACAALSLLPKKKIEDAWEYAQYLMAALQHPMAMLAASVVRYNQAIFAEEHRAKRQFHEEQLRLFDEAESCYSKLPDSAKLNDHYQEIMSVALKAAALARVHLGQEELAAPLIERALAIDPCSPAMRTLRGKLLVPRPEAMEEFRQAIELGEKSFVPYAYLGTDALNRGDYPEALRFYREALLREPNSLATKRLIEFRDIAEQQISANGQSPELAFSEEQLRWPEHPSLDEDSLCSQDEGIKRIYANRELALV